MELVDMAKILQECIDETPYTDPDNLFRLRSKEINCLIHFVECATDESNYILYGFWLKANHAEEEIDISKCDFVGHFEMSGEGNQNGGFYPELLEEVQVREDFRRIIKECIVPTLRAGVIRHIFRA